MPNVGDRVTKLETSMEVVKEGVANFRDFQVDVRDFITRADERALLKDLHDKEDKATNEKRDKKRSRIHFWWLGLLSGLIVVGFGVLLTWVLNFENHHKVSSAHYQSSTQQNADLPATFQR